MKLYDYTTLVDPGGFKRCKIFEKHSYDILLSLISIILYL